MKKRHLVYAIGLIVGMGACAASAKKQAESKPDVWKSYNVGTILFEDKAPETKGSDIYHRIIPDAESYIRPVLYWPLFTIRRKTASLR